MLSPVVFGLSVATQLKVDAGLAVSGILSATPLHIVAGFRFVMTGLGMTDTEYDVGVPLHKPLYRGVTV